MREELITSSVCSTTVVTGDTVFRLLEDELTTGQLVTEVESRAGEDTLLGSGEDGTGGE